MEIKWVSAFCIGTGRQDITKDSKPLILINFIFTPFVLYLVHHSLAVFRVMDEKRHNRKRVCI
jgi:hypothetical protein